MIMLHMGKKYVKKKNQFGIVEVEKSILGHLVIM